MSKDVEKSSGAVIPGSERFLDCRHFHPRCWGTWFAIAFLTTLWLVPRRLRDGIATLLSQLYLRKDSNHRHYARVNLAVCFPQLSMKERRELLTRHFRSFFQVMLDAPLFWWGSDAMILKRVSIVGKEAVDSYVDKGKSIIFLVSHSTALDVCTSALAMHYKLQGFYKPFKDPVIEWLIFRMRSKRGGRLAARGEGFKTVIRDLKKGMAMFYLSDEDLGREGSVFAPFFGQPKATLAMLPRIVKMTNASVFPVYTHYLPKQGVYEINILPVLKNYPTNDPLQDARRLNEATEQTIMLCPEQYLWKLRLFKTTEVEGKKNIYKKVKDGEFDIG